MFIKPAISILSLNPHFYLELLDFIPCQNILNLRVDAQCLGSFFFHVDFFFSFLTNATRLVDKSFIDLKRGLAEAGRTLQRFNFGGGEKSL